MLIGYCVTNLEAVFHRLMIWRILFLPPTGTIKIPIKYKCFTVHTGFAQA